MGFDGFHGRQVGGGVTKVVKEITSGVNAGTVDLIFFRASINSVAGLGNFFFLWDFTFVAWLHLPGEVHSCKFWVTRNSWGIPRELKCSPNVPQEANVPRELLSPEFPVNVKKKKKKTSILIFRSKSGWYLRKIVKILVLPLSNLDHLLFNL